ncbi:hypothetical protein FACS1894129_4410 [Actinomycetota bacterium]|nr:hypothetical protein FACS1894129_4410 [Actinomycetota bacterium]
MPNDPLTRETPMSAPNLFLTYVSDAKRSTAFYSDLFDIEPNFTSPRYVSLRGDTRGAVRHLDRPQRGHHPRHAPHERDRTHGPPVVRGGR